MLTTCRFYKAGGAEIQEGAGRCLDLVSPPSESALAAPPPPTNQTKRLMEDQKKLRNGPPPFTPSPALPKKRGRTVRMRPSRSNGYSKPGCGMAWWQNDVG